MESNGLVATVNQFFQAYNTIDIKYLEGIISDDIHWEHHNRFKGQGKEALMQSIRDFAEKAPGRIFTEPTRWAVNGDSVFIEHKWHAVPASDLPLFGWTKGVPATLDCVSLFVFSAGKIVEWSDYA